MSRKKRKVPTGGWDSQTPYDRGLADGRAWEKRRHELLMYESGRWKNPPPGFIFYPSKPCDPASAEYNRGVDEGADLEFKERLELEAED